MHIIVVVVIMIILVGALFHLIHVYGVNYKKEKVLTPACRLVLPCQYVNIFVPLEYHQLKVWLCCLYGQNMDYYIDNCSMGEILK